MSVDTELADPFVYQSRKHAYQRTDEYLFSQLIPYIGSKRRLLRLIDQAVERTGVIGGLFADLFAGSGVVSRYAKSKGFQVVSNDWEPYAYSLNTAAISLNTPPCSNELIDRLNSLTGIPGYITNNYCPKDDHAADPNAERMYYTRSNGMKIDAIRMKIAEWERSGFIDQDQKHYLLAPLISSASYTSNTSGLFKAYHHGWGGKTSTALYRILSDLVIRPVVLLDNGLDNLTFAADAVDVAENWREIVGNTPSVVYLDPPYNQHPYGSNYHMLNSIALWDCPDVPEMVSAKSAIRSDWKTERRSAYNSSAQALPTLERLLDRLNARWVLISYSTDGNIGVVELVDSLACRGAVSVVANRYKRYRVSSQRMSSRSHNVEFVLILDTLGKPGSGKSAVLHDISLAKKLD